MSREKKPAAPEAPAVEGLTHLQSADASATIATLEKEIDRGLCVMTDISAWIRDQDSEHDVLSFERSHNVLVALLRAREEIGFLRSTLGLEVSR